MRLQSIAPAGKIFYTTGRLTSEMVIKTVQMGIPILISRSGFTAWGVELARKADLTLIGRGQGQALHGALRRRSASSSTPIPTRRRRSRAPSPQGRASDDDE